MKTDLTDKRVLYLSIKKDPFDVMVTAEKDVEYRDQSNWMRSRLLARDGSRKHYDYVVFRNGYSAASPWFLAEYKGFWHVDQLDITYSNGLRVKFSEPKYGIQIGKVIESGNIRPHERKQSQKTAQHSFRDA